MTTASDTLPADVLAFLGEHIESFAQLEAFLLLHRHAGADPPASWIAERVNLPIGAIEEALLHLERHGLVTKVSGTEGYASSAPDELRETIGRLAEAYATQLLLVIRVLNANSMKRARDTAGRLFADAFLLRKRKGDG